MTINIIFNVVTYFIFKKEGKALIKAGGVENQVPLAKADTLEYLKQDRNFDIVSCIGASFIAGNVLDTITLLKRISQVEKETLHLFGDIFREKQADPVAAEKMGSSNIHDVYTLLQLPCIFKQSNLGYIFIIRIKS